MKLFAISHAFIALLATVALTSCSDDFEQEGGEKNRDEREMVFYASSAEMTDLTRGSLSAQAAVPSSALLLRGSNKADSLFCYVCAEPISSEALTRGSYNNEQTDFSEMSITAVCRMSKDNAQSYYFKNVVYSRTADSEGSLALWQSASIYYWWGAAENYTFYGVAPWGAQAHGLSVNTDAETPSLTYSVPKSATDQTDLLAVKTPEYRGDHNKSVPLNYKHILSAIEIKQGLGMRAGNIKSVTFKNLKGSGTYSFDENRWSLVDATGDFSLTGDFPASDGTSISGNDKVMFLLPQDLTGAEVEVTLEYNGETKIYTTALSGSWQAGQKYVYTITINPEFKFETDSNILDAHYEKFAVTVTPDAVVQTGTWTITSDIPGVTFLSDADYQNGTQYALLRQGFWTDRILDGNNSNADIGSARGESSITFTGNSPQKIWVFVPENNSADLRNITLKASTGPTVAVVYDKVSQYAAWGANDGWEQIPDTQTGAYGFHWDLLVSYQYVYSHSIFGDTNDKNYCNNLISLNNASSYAKTQEFHYKPVAYRYCITLDYSKLNNLTDALSRTDGLGNTKALFNHGKGASTAAFETVLKNTLKTESGKENQPAFRKMVKDDLYRGTWSDYANNGTAVNGSDALGEILKKNKYNIVRLETTSSEGDKVRSYSPLITASDVVWYFPAVDEFSSAPTTVAIPIDKSGWSSTAVSGATNALLGNGTSVDRNTKATIRARRTR